MGLWGGWLTVQKILHWHGLEPHHIDERFSQRNKTSMTRSLRKCHCLPLLGHPLQVLAPSLPTVPCTKHYSLNNSQITLYFPAELHRDQIKRCIVFVSFIFCVKKKSQLCLIFKTRFSWSQPVLICKATWACPLSLIQNTSLHISVFFRVDSLSYWCSLCACGNPRAYGGGGVFNCWGGHGMGRVKDFGFSLDSTALLVNIHWERTLWSFQAFEGHS